MSNIPTAEEFLKIDNGFDDNDMELLAKSLKTENRMDISDICQTMIEFAKLHVEEALKKADNHAKMYNSTENIKDSILNAYSLENIK